MDGWMGFPCIKQKKIVYMHIHTHTNTYIHARMHTHIFFLFITDTTDEHNGNVQSKSKKKNIWGKNKLKKRNDLFLYRNLRASNSLAL